MKNLVIVWLAAVILVQIADQFRIHSLESRISNLEATANAHSMELGHLGKDVEKLADAIQSNTSSIEILSR